MSASHIGMIPALGSREWMFAETILTVFGFLGSLQLVMSKPVFL